MFWHMSLQLSRISPWVVFAHPSNSLYGTLHASSNVTLFPKEEIFPKAWRSSEHVSTSGGKWHVGGRWSAYNNALIVTILN